MIAARKLLARLARDERGAMLIETAFIAPVLILLSLGAFQVSQVVARQTELQEAAAQAASIAMAAAPDTAAKRTVVKNVIVASTGLAADKVTITEKFRCGTDTTFVDSASTCVGVKVANYVLIQIDDTYTPLWARWGFGSALTFNVDRYVMVKQT
jgi:Flp pilus assembly protein TadG